MSQKASAFRLVWTDWKMASPTRNQILMLVLSLAAVMLAAATVYLLVSVISPDGSSGIAAGVEASSARWTALGEYYAPESNAAAAASSARWTALGEHYRAESLRAERSANASSARWSALGAYHLARYEAAAAASSARYQAMADWYAAKAAQR